MGNYKRSTHITAMTVKRRNINCKIEWLCETKKITIENPNQLGFSATVALYHVKENIEKIFSSHESDCYTLSPALRYKAHNFSGTSCSVIHLFFVWCTNVMVPGNIVFT